MSTLADLLPRRAAERGDAPAVSLDDAVLSWADLDDRTARVAGLLRGGGLQPGDRVAIVLPNLPHFPVVYFGALRAGAVVVPMNPLLHEREVRHHLTDSGATWVFAWKDVAERVAAGAEGTGARVVVVDPTDGGALLAGVDRDDAIHPAGDDDTAVLLYTSGTTGSPKGAELSHRNLLSNAVTSHETLIQLGPDDVVLGALPLFHAFGQTCAQNTALVGGARLTLLPRFSAEAALRVVERDRVTRFLGVPTMYVALVHAPDSPADTSSLTRCISGGASLPVEVLKAFEERYGCAILEGYGLSETSPVASFNLPDRVRKPGSIGVPVRGCEMDLRTPDGAPTPEGEVGEIVIRGENVMKGYWRNESATRSAIDADGWFRSGDLARRDEDGYYTIVDRAKDMIIRSGYNVYPREVEEVLYEHPAVEQAAVVGIPDDEHGEEIGAAVVLRAGHTATEQELREHVAAALAAYKYPRRIWFVDDLPKGPTGKILKREIKP
ncbi:long-chain fatty acid--CoA ligase [Kineococcus gynurae]|uniref:Long-chain fatty acid--CoA ligase n=1 Tax=Kineococcus gynurae TaxID=452979 RepID=A0ABV5LW15_9ACTN